MYLGKYLDCGMSQSFFLVSLIWQGYEIDNYIYELNGRNVFFSLVLKKWVLELKI